MKIKYVKQTDLNDCGVSCLMSIVMYYGGYVSREYLREITKTTKDGVSVYSLVECASKLGMEAKGVRGCLEKIASQVPCIAHIIVDNHRGHFVVIYSINKDKIKIMDPSYGFKTLSVNEWNNITTNIYLLYKPVSKILIQEEDVTLLNFSFLSLKKYKDIFFIIMFLSIVYTISSILISYEIEFFMKLSINKINYIFIFLVLILLLREFSNLFRNNLINYFNHSLDKSLITEIYNHLIRLPYLYFKNRTKGDMITRIEDIFKIRELISKLLVTIVIDLVYACLILLIIFKLNINVFLITILITIIYLVVIIIYNRIIIKKLKLLKEKESIVNNHLIESLSSIDTIKGMNIEDYMKDKFEYKYSLLQEDSFIINKKYINENFFKGLIYGLGILFVIYYSYLDIAKLIIIYSLFIYYFEPINNISNLDLLISDTKVSFIRIKELLNIKNENLFVNQKISNKHLLGNIIINNLEYSYNGISDVLTCNKLVINTSNKVLLYGTSGGGKSTLMKLIVKYLDNYNGEILIDERNLNSYNLLDIRNKITYISQDELIYSDTIYNNIVLNNNISYAKYLEIIKLTGVSKIINRSILKDEMFLDNSASNLSGGEKQRIILARALAKESDIYIFDEATNALDIKNERYLLKNIFKYLEHKTVIVISHRFNNRDLYQRFVLVERGKVYEY